MRTLPLHAHDPSAASLTNSIMIGTPIFSRADPCIAQKEDSYESLIPKGLACEFEHIE